jgi:hypothetical protein
VVTGWVAVNVVFSVGPYPFTSRIPGTRVSTAAQAAGGSTSPPASSTRKPASTPGSAAATWPNTPAVSHSTLTRCAERNPPSSDADSAPCGPTARTAPLASAPQISNVAASNDGGASCATTSPGVTGQNPLSLTSRPTAAWVTVTPLGTPVDPEVYITYAASEAASPGTGSTAASSPVTRSPSTTTAGPASASMNAIRSAG